MISQSRYPVLFRVAKVIIVTGSFVMTMTGKPGEWEFFPYG